MDEDVGVFTVSAELLQERLPSLSLLIVCVCEYRYRCLYTSLSLLPLCTITERLQSLDPFMLLEPNYYVTSH